LAGRTIHEERVITHHADLQLPRHHPVRYRWTGGEVLPVDLVIDILVFAIVRQEFVEQIQLPDDCASGHGVGGHVLRSNTDDQSGTSMGRNAYCEQHGQSSGDGIASTPHFSVQ